MQSIITNPIFILISFIVIGTVVSVAARFLELKGLQVWLPFAVLLAIGWHPMVGLGAAAIIMIISFVMKPYPPPTLVAMLLLLAPALFSFTLFEITRASFVFTSMLVTVAYLIASDIVLWFIYPDVKTAILWLAFSIPISWIMYSEIGWSIVSILQRSGVPFL